MRALTEYIATLKEGDTFEAYLNENHKPIETFIVKKVKKTTLQCKIVNQEYTMYAFNKKSGQYKYLIDKVFGSIIYTIILPKEFVEKFM